MPKFDSKILSLGLPILGICYGHQLIAHLAGGKVTKGERGEYGVSLLKIDSKKQIFRNLPNNLKVWMSHGDTVRAKLVIKKSH